MKAKFLFFIFSSIFISNIFGQLSGTYTIGGINPDYTTIDNAVLDLTTVGVSGSVTFNIRPGNYSGFTITDSIPYLMYPDSVTFQSETQDSTDVTISAISGTVKLIRTNSITLKWLTIVATGTSTSIAISFSESFNCNILNCIISTPNSQGYSNMDETAVDIAHRWSNPYSSMKIKDCIISGSANGFYLHGPKGSTEIINCNVITTGRYSVYTHSVEFLTIEGSTLNGNFYTFNSQGPSFKNNLVIGDDLSIPKFTFLEENEFISLNGQYIHIFYSEKIRNNSFNELCRTCADVIDSNTFSNGVNSSHCDGFQFYNNVVGGRANFSFCDNILLRNNEFSDDVHLGMCDNSRLHSNSFSQIADIGVSNNVWLYNNLFYNVLEIGICIGTKVYYNNFSNSSYLISKYNNPVDTRYNNFSQDAYIPYYSYISHNNYYPTGGKFDKNPFNYDPQYINSTNLRAQNPLLIDKGEYVSFMTEDIDGSKRSNTPTIGANEICISSFTSLDSVNIICGDEINFKLCSIDSSANNYWSPSAGLNDSLLLSPTASPRETTKYYLFDTTGTAIDSALIIVNDFIPQAIPDVPINCLQAALLNGTFNPSATYVWTPAEGLSDSTVHNPIAKPDTSTVYFQQIIIPGCGVYYDTAFIEVDQTPIASALWSFNYLEVTFYNHSACSDSFLWDFSDGQFSNDSDPIHNYSASGTYLVTLIAYNSISSDTFQFSVNVQGVGIEELTNEGANIKVYPNPTRDIITISILTDLFPQEYLVEIYDITGKEVYNHVINDKRDKITINIQHLSNGIYFLKIRGNMRSHTVKVVKE